MADDIHNPQDSAKIISEAILNKEQEIVKAIDEKYPLVKVDKRTVKKQFNKPTELTIEQYNDLLYDIACYVPIIRIIKKHKIGQHRINNIIRRDCDKISQLRAKITLEQEKQFNELAVLKRDEVIKSIDEKDIKRAKLAQKGIFIESMTKVRRLESGLSTENVAILTAQMSDDELRNYVLTGNVNNKTSNVNEIIDSQKEKINEKV